MEIDFTRIDLFNLGHENFLGLRNILNIKLIIDSIVALAIPFVSRSADSEKTVIGRVAMPEVQDIGPLKQIKKKLRRWEGKMTHNLTGEVIQVAYEWKLTSEGRSITETVVEDEVKVLTTYSNDEGEEFGIEMVPF